MISFLGSLKAGLTFFPTLPAVIAAGREVATLHELPDAALARLSLVRSRLVQDVFSRRGLMGSHRDGTEDCASDRTRRQSERRSESTPESGARCGIQVGAR